MWAGLRFVRHWCADIRADVAEVARGAEAVGLWASGYAWLRFQMRQRDWQGWLCLGLRCLCPVWNGILLQSFTSDFVGLGNREECYETNTEAKKVVDALVVDHLLNRGQIDVADILVKVRTKYTHKKMAKYTFFSVVYTVGITKTKAFSPLAELEVSDRSF